MLANKIKKDSKFIDRLRFKIMRDFANLTRKSKSPNIRKVAKFFCAPGRHLNYPTEIIFEYDNKMLIHINTASWIEWNIYFHGYYEPKIVDTMKHLIKLGFTVVDVGANVGCHTLIMASLVGSQGKVIAVEPHPEIYKRLVKNIRLNRFENVDTFRCALSDFQGISKLYSFEEFEEAFNEGRSSLLKPLKKKPKKYYKVEVTTLDDIIMESNYNRLDLIKIDTEGHDIRVLRGGVNSIEKYRPHIIFEYDAHLWSHAGSNYHQVEKFFKDKDYDLHIIKGGYILNTKYRYPEQDEILAVPHGVNFRNIK